MKCCLLAPFQNVSEKAAYVCRYPAAHSDAFSTSQMCRLKVFWSWCWAPWSVQLSLIGTIIRPFCYKPNTLKIIFFTYCTCQGVAPATFNDAGNPITANTNTPLQKGCRTIARTCWKIFQKAFAPLHINIWIFYRNILAFWAKIRYSLEQERDQRSELPAAQIKAFSQGHGDAASDIYFRKIPYPWQML